MHSDFKICKRTKQFALMNTLGNAIPFKAIEKNHAVGE